jgi:hypothetical protein
VAGRRRSEGPAATQEITEGFAAARGLALPSQLRRLLRAQGRDLHAEFVRLLPAPPQPIRIQRWSPQRIGLWVLLVALLAIVARVVSDNVSNNEGRAAPLNIPNLSCADLEPQWLEAQSVPSASLVPCLRSLPTGWSLQKATVNDGRSVLTLDSGGGGSVVVRMTASCDPRGATPVASDQGAARRYLRVDQEAPEFLATRFDVFAGGCVTTRLAAPAAKRSELVAQVGAPLDFTTCQALQRALAARSDGRLHLDPGRP